MSHFAVAVISRTPEEVKLLLAPYQENNMGDCPAEYLEFVDEEETGKDSYETGYIEMVQTPEGQLLNRSDERFKVENPETLMTEYLIPKDHKEVLVPIKDCFPTFEEYMEKYFGYCERDPQKGRYGYWANPNAKWDYWSIGGRFHGLLKVCGKEDPARYDQAQIKDIDFSMDQEIYDKAVRFWEVYVEKAPLKPDEDSQDFNSFYSPKYFKDFYGSKEGYAEDRAYFTPWAFVTSDGRWIEKGEMGWWAAHNGTSKSFRDFLEAWKKTLSECDPESYITIVDCHI